jgi:SHAQKYF class myb-like DNA-binding protein
MASSVMLSSGSSMVSEDGGSLSGGDAARRAPPPPSASSSSSQTKKHPTGENTGRWTKEEHQTFLDGLKQHGKEWKKIANMIATRTVVQIRTHAQKYFQKLAKSRELKGQEIPQDLVSTASIPRHGEVKAKSKSKSGKLSATGLLTSLRSDTPLPPGAGGDLGDLLEHEGDGFEPSSASSSSSPTRELDEEDEGCGAGAEDDEMCESDGSVIMDLIGADDGGEAEEEAEEEAEDVQMQMHAPAGPLLPESPLKRKLSAALEACGEVPPATPHSATQRRAMSPPGSAAMARDAGAAKKQLQLSPNNNLGASTKLKKAAIAFKVEQHPAASFSSSLLLQQHGGSPSASSLSGTDPLVSPRVSLGGGADEDEVDAASTLTAEKSAAAGAGAGAAAAAVNAKHQQQPCRAQPHVRRLTISTHLSNGLSAKDIKSRDEEDLKWLVSMSTRGSPTAVSDFGFYREFEADEDVLFPLTPTHHQRAASEATLAKVTVSTVDKLKPVPAAAAAAPAPAAAHISNSSNAGAWIGAEADSDILSVASDCELEHQPELAEMGPFTKFVFGDDAAESPAAKRQRVAAN